MKSISLTTALCLSLVAGTLAISQDETGTGTVSRLNAAKDHKRVVAARQVPDAKDHKATVAARAPVAKDHKHTEAARVRQTFPTYIRGSHWLIISPHQAPVAKDHSPVQAAQEPTFVTLVARPKDHRHFQAAVNPEPTQVD
ncbi:hypothetical protein PG984_014693 [Apiospora sp. TS-2023a]